MSDPTRTSLRPFIGCLLALALGCHASPDDVDPGDQARALETPQLEGRRVEFALEPGAATPRELRDVAEFLEQGSEIHRAQVKIKQSDKDATVVVIELWGHAFPSQDALTDQLRQRFDFLQDALFTQTVLAEPQQSVAKFDVDPEDDPQTVKAKITEELRASGVTGDITVDVTDHAGQRHVEVSVQERRCAPNSDCPPADATK